MAVKRKKFFKVEVSFTNSSIELLAYDIQDLENKTIKLDLTRQLKGKSMEVVLKIKVARGEAAAFPQRLTLLPFFIKRMMRKNISYIEDSFSAECKDAFIKFKPFLITRKKVSRKVRKALREEAKRRIIDYSKDKFCTEIFTDIISNRLQKPLSLALKKIYPLALCEIRFLKIEKPKEQEKLKVTIEKVKTEEEKIEETEERKEEEKEEKEAEESAEKQEEVKKE